MCFCCPGFYIIRVQAGGDAAGVPVSAWLLDFSLFFFLSLAFAKRFVELDQLGAGGRYARHRPRLSHDRYSDDCHAWRCQWIYRDTGLFLVFNDEPQVFAFM